MSYTRVIPRDLFNEANLLKCLGQLYLKLEQGYQRIAELEFDAEQSETFDIQRNDDSGDIYVDDIKLKIFRSPLNAGLPWYHTLFRPINSREPYPLWLTTSWNTDPIQVFNPDGELSNDMVTWLKLQQ